RNCRLILYRRLFLDRSSPFDFCLLQSWRYPVEHIDGTYSTLCKIRCPVEETTKMARHAALPVHHRNARRAPYYRQELVGCIVSVHSEGCSCRLVKRYVSMRNKLSGIYGYLSLGL